MSCISLICNSPECCSGDRRFSAVAADGRCSSLPSSSTSSIGKNSDDSDGDGEEVQSEYKGGPLDGFDALEKVLPIKKGISKFYCGKSKSFTSLSDASSCSSVKDIANFLSRNSSSPGGCLPPLPPHARKAEDNELSSPPPSEKFAPWRSFSLSDLQGAAAAGPSITGLWIINKDK
ncbi:Uncharacterized protein Adt_07702 [Abeliophyllum distichum]|uniref:Uncharacterized protein n=1 Tax=Abeliophyllum distichum TaxID=126358 RepID=A0ABD1VAW9_9LAMI